MLYNLFKMATLKKDQKLGFKTNYCLMQVKSIAELSRPRCEKTWHCCMQTTKVQTSLHICTVWSAPLLGFTQWDGPSMRYICTVMSFFKYAWVVIQCCLISGLDLNHHETSILCHSMCGHQAHKLIGSDSFEHLMVTLCNKYKILPSGIKW